MGSICGEVKFRVTDVVNRNDESEECYLYVFYDEGDDSAYGYEIELSYYSYSVAETLFCCTFGYEEWSSELWEMFGDAVCHYLEQFEEEGPEAVERGLQELDSMNLDNYYNCLQEPSEFQPIEKLKAEHMDRIENVLAFIKKYDQIKCDHFLKRYPLEVLKKWNDNAHE